MRKVLSMATLVMICSMISAQQIQKVNINVKANNPSGIIDSKIYGQLFEHIYFSADGGLCGEMIAERSFEPEQYNGMPKRDGYFDGWYGINNKTLISPTLFDHPIPLVTVEDDSYTISTDLKWRSYKL